MATDIELNAKINTANSAQSLGELKKSLKDLISLQAQVGSGTEGFKKLQKTINDTESKLGDLKDGFKTLSGSGVERLTASLGLLREGFTSADPEKVGVAFKGLGAAMAAIPIFLILEGVKLLVDNFKDIIKFFGVGVKESDRLTISLEKQKKVNEGLFSTQENAITIMKAEGASIKSIIAATQKLNDAKIKQAKQDIELQKLKIREVLLNDSVTESLQRTAASVLRAQGNSRDADRLEAKINADKLKRASEFGGQIRTDLIAIGKLETDNKVQVVEAEKKHTEDLKKINKERKKDKEDKSKADKEQSIKDAEDLFKQLSLRQDNELALRNKARKDEKDAAKIAANQKFLDDKFISDFIADEYLKEQQIKSAQLEAEKFITNQKLKNANDLINGLSSIGIKNKAIANTIFAVQKAVAIGGVIVDVQKEIAAYKANPTWSLLPDGGAAIKSAAIIQAKVGAGIRIATIAATSISKFINGGGSGDVGGGSTSSIGGSGATITPPQPQSLAFNQNTVNQVGSVGGNQQPQKVVLVSHDVTRAQKNDRVIEMQATF